jgi:hypothetical protein
MMGYLRKQGGVDVNLKSTTFVDFWDNPRVGDVGGAQSRDGNHSSHQCEHP